MLDSYKASPAYPPRAGRWKLPSERKRNVIGALNTSQRGTSTGQEATSDLFRACPQPVAQLGKAEAGMAKALPGSRPCREAGAKKRAHVLGGKKGKS